MNPCTALVPVRNRPAAAGVSALRQALRRGALDRAIEPAALPLRFQHETLEPRRMLSAVGTIQFAGYSGYATPAAMAVTADGKIYVVSDLQASTAGGDGSDYQMRRGLARFNSDGSPDASFGPDGTGVEQFTLGSDQSYPQQ